MRKLVRVLTVAFLTAAANSAMASSLYIGMFTFDGYTNGGSASADLVTNSLAYFDEFEVEMSGGCGFNAQVLYNAQRGRLAPTRLIRSYYTPNRVNSITYQFRINNGIAAQITGVRGYLSGQRGFHCQGHVTLQSPDVTPPPPPPTQMTSIRGTITWINPISTGNGDSSLRIRDERTQQEYEVNLIGTPTNLPYHTEYHFSRISYVSQLLGRAAQINGYWNGRGIDATDVWDL